MVRSGVLKVLGLAFIWWKEREYIRVEVVLGFKKTDQIEALVCQMFGMWEGKVAVGILKGIT